MTSELVKQLCMAGTCKGVFFIYIGSAVAGRKLSGRIARPIKGRAHMLEVSYIHR